MAKQPGGALEQEIMVVLWAAERALPPGEIRARLNRDLAYTSVATVLGRLQSKGLVERIESGRAFVYRAVVDEPELAARRIGAVLSATSDRAAVLARFIGNLSKRDAKALRAILDGIEP